MDRYTRLCYAIQPGKPVRQAFSLLQHVGVYGFPATLIPQIMMLQPSANERSESLEQLRWLDHGMNILTVKTEKITPSVDTPEDLQLLLENCRHLLD